MAGAQVGMHLLDGDKLIKQINQLVGEIRDKVVVDAIEAGMQPVQRSVVANAPESSGSREKQSQRTRQKWQNSRKLKTTIRSVVRTKRRAGITAGLIGLVGPSYDHGGGHGNLFSRDHKRKVLWGRDAGTIRTVNQFVKKAADQSQSAASAAVTASVRQGVAQAAARAVNG